ncbi:hypothetical protein CBL_05448 [Carabus blaptoides fortunei]
MEQSSNKNSRRILERAKTARLLDHPQFLITEQGTERVGRRYAHHRIAASRTSYRIVQRRVTGSDRERTLVIEVLDGCINGQSDMMIIDGGPVATRTTDSRSGTRATLARCCVSAGSKGTRGSSVRSMKSVIRNERPPQPAQISETRRPGVALPAVHIRLPMWLLLRYVYSCFYVQIGESGDPTTAGWLAGIRASTTPNSWIFIQIEMAQNESERRCETVRESGLQPLWLSLFIGNIIYMAFRTVVCIPFERVTTIRQIIALCSWIILQDAANIIGETDRRINEKRKWNPCRQQTQPMCTDAVGIVNQMNDRGTGLKWTYERTW